MKQKFLTALLRILGEERVISDAERLEPYGRDETPELFTLPDVVALPESSEQVERVVHLCYEHSVPITPRGAGTGVAGGAVPVRAGLVISLSKMNKICDIDEKNLIAVVQPGVITGDLQRAVETENLFYPPDPASVDSCSIGGNVATSAGGMKAFKYGTTKRFVNGLEVVMPPGRKIRLGGKMLKDVAGYDLASLIIGSEGTLGIITEISLRLLPKPAHSYDLLAGFDSIATAVNAALSIVPETAVMPAAMELVERDIVTIIEQFRGKKLPLSIAAAQIIITIDGTDEEQVERELFAVGEHLLSKGAIEVYVAMNRLTSDNLWRNRRGIREALRHRSPDIIAEDIAVPPAKVTEMLTEVKRLGKKNEVAIVGFGHIGDGNIHIDLLRDDMEKSRWEHIKEKVVPQILSLAVQLGGTITGEHGIGYLKRKYLSIGAENFTIKRMKQIKNAIDPAGLMNPEKVFL